MDSHTIANRVFDREFQNNVKHVSDFITNVYVLSIFIYALLDIAVEEHLRVHPPIADQEIQTRKELLLLRCCGVGLSLEPSCRTCGLVFIVLASEMA